MSIAPVSFGSALSGAGAIPRLNTSAGPAETGASNSFAGVLAQGMQNLQAAQSKQDTLAVQAATGDLTNVHDYTVAAAEAKLATSLTVALRDKAVGAFNEILRMQA